MTSKNFSLVVQVLLNTLVRGQQSSWAEEAGVDNTVSMLLLLSRVCFIYLLNFFFLCFHPTSEKRAPGLGVIALARKQNFCEHLCSFVYLVVVVVSSGTVPFDSVKRLSVCVLHHFSLQDFYACKEYSPEGVFIVLLNVC